MAWWARALGPSADPHRACLGYKRGAPRRDIAHCVVDMVPGFCVNRLYFVEWRISGNSKCGAERTS